MSLAEKIVIPAGGRVIAPGKISAGILRGGGWMAGDLHKPPGGKCVMVGRSLVEGGARRVAVESVTHRRKMSSLTKIHILPWYIH